MITLVLVLGHLIENCSITYPLFYLLAECVLPASAALITVVGAERRLDAALNRC